MRPRCTAGLFLGVLGWCALPYGAGPPLPISSCARSRRYSRISFVISMRCRRIASCAARYTSLPKNTVITRASAPITSCAQVVGNPDIPGGGPVSSTSVSASLSAWARSHSRCLLQYDGLRLLHRACVRCFCLRRHSGAPHVRCRAPTRASGLNHRLHTEHGLLRRRHRDLVMPPSQGAVSERAGPLHRVLQHPRPASPVNLSAI